MADPSATITTGKILQVRCKGLRKTAEEIRENMALVHVQDNQVYTLQEMVDGDLENHDGFDALVLDVDIVMMEQQDMCHALDCVQLPYDEVVDPANQIIRSSQNIGKPGDHNRAELARFQKLVKEYERTAKNANDLKEETEATISERHAEISKLLDEIASLAGQKWPEAQVGRILKNKFGRDAH